MSQPTAEPPAQSQGEFSMEGDGGRPDKSRQQVLPAGSLGPVKPAEAHSLGGMQARPREAPGEDGPGPLRP